MYGVACVLLFLMDYGVHTFLHLAFSPEKHMKSFQINLCNSMSFCGMTS